MKPPDPWPPLPPAEAQILAALSPSQPAPVANSLPAVWPAVIADMQARDQLGRERYGVPLQPANGRNALLDAYEESLDKSAYLKSALMEQQMLRGLLEEALKAARRGWSVDAGDLVERALELVPAERSGK